MLSNRSSVLSMTGLMDAASLLTNGEDDRKRVDPIYRAATTQISKAAHRLLCWMAPPSI